MSALLLISFISIPLVFKTPKISPAFLFCLFWTTQFILCYAIFQNTTWSLETPVWLVCIFISAFLGQHVGWLAFNIYGAKWCKNEHARSFDAKRAKDLLIICITVALIYSIRNIISRGFSLSSFSSISSMAAMNNSIAVDRYGGGGNSSHGVFDTLLLTFVYFAPMIAGFILPYLNRGKDKILICLSFVPALLVLLTENTKAVFIAVAIFFLAAYVVSSLMLYGKLGLNPKRIIIIIALLTAMLALLLFSMMLRIGSIDDASLNAAILKFGNYAFGHVAAFDNWLPSNMFPLDLGFGYNSLIGVARFLFSGTRVQGIYRDYYRGEELVTNVFSYFRGFVQDFGSIGSLLVAFFLFAIAGYAFYSLKNGDKHSLMCVVLLLMAYCTIFYYIVSLFSYTSFILLFPLFAIYYSLTWKREK